MYKQPYTLEDVEVKRDGDKLLITMKTDENWKLLMGKHPTKDAIHDEICQSANGVCEVALPAHLGPYYFIAKTKERETPIFGERVLPLKGAINVRDMGGYQTNSNQRVKWGKLYRGDQLSKLEKEDVSILEKIGLQTIVDYRSNHEQTLNPNKEIATVKQTLSCDPHSSFSEAAARAIDLDEENRNLVNALKEGKIATKYINGKGLKVIESYKSLVESEQAIAAYKEMIHTCANPAFAPSLQHCRGGKDRTGFGCMLLLWLLGVKEEQVRLDYILTGIIREARNNFKLQQYQALTNNQDYLDYLMSMIETRESYIQASMEYIKEKYGTIDNYAIQVLEMTEKEIEEMKNYYLEEG